MTFVELVPRHVAQFLNDEHDVKMVVQLTIVVNMVLAQNQYRPVMMTTDPAQCPFLFEIDVSVVDHVSH